ncbi:spore photoproduct lyase family protein, partial [Bacteroides sp. Phil13]|uniref:spore photoproduct lyase family protein n=1 Tax=Bacteroides sp. Phil13 TaxID=1929999 RepID=UPI000B20C4EB
CMGQCEYCYLHTQLGDKPYIRVNVNIEEILERASKYMDESKDGFTTFEGSATSDPLCVEPYTHALAKTIEFFANEPRGAFRFVSKYSDVDGLLDLKHNNKTEVRFSLNTERVRSEYEHATATVAARLHAAAKMSKAGYPIGFLIAPVFIYDGWKKEYEELLRNLADTLPAQLEHRLFFEVISHRYTPKAKDMIQEIFPTSTLPMNDEERKYRRGQFGYGKYHYTKEDMQEMKAFFQEKLLEYFPTCEIKYII